MRPPIRRAFNWRLRDIAKGEGLGRFWYLTLLPLHMLQGPEIPYDTAVRYVRVPGQEWVIRDFRASPGAQEWTVKIHQTTFHKYEFGSGWWQLVKDKRLEPGETVGFQVSEELRVLDMVRGLEACRDFVPTDYPLPYIRQREFMRLKYIYRHPKFSVFDYLRKTNPWGIERELWSGRSYSEKTDLMVGINRELEKFGDNAEAKKEYLLGNPLTRRKPPQIGSHVKETISDRRMFEYLRKDNRHRRPG